MPRHLLLSIMKARGNIKLGGGSLLCGKAEPPRSFAMQLAATFFSLANVKDNRFQPGEATPKLSSGNMGFSQTSSTMSTTITICSAF